MGGAGGRQVGVEFIEAAAGADRGHGFGERGLSRRRVVHRPGGDRGQAGAHGESREAIVGDVVARVPVVGELHEHPVAPEEGGQPIELRPGGLLAVVERAPHRPLAASGEHHPVLAPGVGQRLELVDGAPLRAARELPRGDGGGEAMVSAHPLREEEQVGAPRVGDAELRDVQVERELGAVDGGELGEAARGIGEDGGPLQAVVIGEGEARQTQACGFRDEHFGRTGAVEEAEVAVRVQLGVAGGFRGRVRVRMPPAFRGRLGSSGLGGPYRPPRPHRV